MKDMNGACKDGPPQDAEIGPPDYDDPESVVGSAVQKFKGASGLTDAKNLLREEEDSLPLVG
jgi:hypothetical protein